MSRLIRAAAWRVSGVSGALAPVRPSVKQVITTAPMRSAANDRRRSPRNCSNRALRVNSRQTGASALGATQ